MSNLSNRKKTIIYLFLFLLNFILISDVKSHEQNQILYPSVLSLHNKGIAVVQIDGIHFYDSDKKEEISKKIKLESLIMSPEENLKISMSQFCENDGGYILIFIVDRLFIMKSDGTLLKEIFLPEIKNFENLSIIPFKEKNNKLLYIILFQKDSNHFSFNYYKYNLNEKTNSLINTEVIEGLKTQGSLLSKEIKGETCLFMKKEGIDEDIFSCFIGVGFPAEIQVRTFTIKEEELIEENNNFRYLFHQNDIKTFNLISAFLNNDNKNSAIIYYDKNNILSKIEFDFYKGLFSPKMVKPEVNLTDTFWQEEADKMQESKETIFSSRLYFVYCQSYTIFFNSNFTLKNQGFISHDNKCSKLLSYSEFFKENKYSMSIERINNNKILIQKRRKLERSLEEINVPEKCETYSEESLTYNLCIKCNNEHQYYKVLIGSDYDHNFVECYNEQTKKKNFYFDTNEFAYKPCYETCQTCETGGNAYNHNCTSCTLGYVFIDSKCREECSYAYYYKYSFEYYECTSTNSCPEEAPYFVPDKRKCVRNCQDEIPYIWEYAGNCYKNCSDMNADIGNELSKTCKDKPGYPVVTYNSFDSDKFINVEGIILNVKKYAKSFPDTTTHINVYNNSNAKLIIYRDETCIKELNIEIPIIHLEETCEKKIYELVNNKKTDIITALVGGSTPSSGIQTAFSLFYKNGTYININKICGDVYVEVINKIDLEEISEGALYIAKQGINIFNISNPFYADVCFKFDSPNGRDATPLDRFKAYFPNVLLCELGCEFSSVDLYTFESTCKCLINDIVNSTSRFGLGENIFENIGNNIFIEKYYNRIIVNNVNIAIFKCYGDVAKNFFKNVGTYIVLGIIIAQAACVVVYYLLSYNSMQRYLNSLSEYQCSVIKMKTNKKGMDNKIEDNILNNELQKAKARPKKHGLKTQATHILIIDEDSRQPKKLDINSNEPNNSFSKLNKKNEKNKSDNDKNEKKSEYVDKLKDEYNIDMEEYLKTDAEDMQFDDALKYDKRTFCEYFCEKYKENQIIMNIFCNHEELKPKTIKIIIEFLNVILCFIINGLFYTEKYISDLFNSNDSESFFSFFPRSISRIIDTTIVVLIIDIIVDCLSVDEKIVKRLFLREKKSTLKIEYEIGKITKRIKRNYLILMIICLVIDLISLYYVNCFNNVYPSLVREWIKSSICVIIIIQLLTIFIGLVLALIRLISFKCGGERFYKIKSDLFVKFFICFILAIIPA